MNVAATYQVRPICDWTSEDVCDWLRAGSKNEGGWEKKLASDYSLLFEACGVDGDYLETMKTWEKDDWKAMADEIDEDLRKQGISVVKLGDRTKIRKEIERVASQTAEREAVWKERQEKLQKEKADAEERTRGEERAQQEKIELARLEREAAIKMKEDDEKRKIEKLIEEENERKRRQEMKIKERADLVAEKRREKEDAA